MAKHEKLSLGTPGKIARWLRRSIVAGDWPPGGRLPTREEIRESCGASPVTVQRAFDRLIRDGFLVARGREGTFVAEAPPHMHRYALVFPGIRKEVSAFFKLIHHCLTGAAGPHDTIKVFDDVRPSLKCKSYRALRADVLRQRLAGIIFSQEPQSMLDSFIMNPALKLPRVAIMMPADYVSFPTIYPDHRSLIDHALDDLKSRGRKRVAVITTLNGFHGCDEHLLRALEKRQFVCPPHWHIPIRPLEPETVYSVVRLLFHAGQKERPTGLLLTDDHHIEPALAALRDERVRIPEDLDVAAHTNFPMKPAPSLPLRRVGFDVAALASRCFELLRTQREGRRALNFTACPGVPFDEARHLETQPQEAQR